MSIFRYKYNYRQVCNRTERLCFEKFKKEIKIFYIYGIFYICVKQLTHVEMFVKYYIWGSPTLTLTVNFEK